MANEAVIMELIEGGNPIRLKCAEGATIDKGTLLKVVDGRIAQATSGANDPFIGIAAHDKVTGDGSDEISVYTKGIFLLRASDTTARGSRIKISGANTVLPSDDNSLLLGLSGTALTGTTGAGDIEVFVGYNNQ